MKNGKLIFFQFAAFGLAVVNNHYSFFGHSEFLSFGHNLISCNLYGLALSTLAGNGLILTRRTMHPKIRVTTLAEQEQSLGVSIFTNPLGLRLKFSRAHTGLAYKFYMTGGVLLEGDVILSSETIIDMKKYKTGVYLLILFINGKESGSYKIAKR